MDTGRGRKGSVIYFCVIVLQIYLTDVTGIAVKADRGRGGKTTSGNGQARSSPNPRGQWITGKNGGNWLRNHLWCSNDPRG